MDKKQKLKVLADEVAKCTKCVLHENRIKSVFGRGNPDSEIVFVGEAPGQSESEQGFPFVGRAGKLLDSMVSAMGYEREDVYILNTTKCHPPKNRKPEPEEKEACYPFFLQQFEILKPKVIVALGATAADSLLGPGPSMAQRRGKWGKWNNIDVIVTYHPAACLYNPSLKPTVADDLKKVLVFLGKLKET